MVTIITSSQFLLCTNIILSCLMFDSPGHHLLLVVVGASSSSTSGISLSLSSLTFCGGNHLLIEQCESYTQCTCRVSASCFHYVSESCLAVCFSMLHPRLLMVGEESIELASSKTSVTFVLVENYHA